MIATDVFLCNNTNKNILILGTRNSSDNFAEPEAQEFSFSLNAIALSAPKRANSY